MQVKTKKKREYVAPELKQYRVKTARIMVGSALDVKTTVNPWENNTEEEW